MAFVVVTTPTTTTTMTSHELDATSINAALELLSENGFDGLADALQILMNEAMLIERSDFLGAGRYERTESRRGYANGFKPKRVRTRVGEVALHVPQVRDQGEDGERFYPKRSREGPAQ